LCCWKYPQIIHDIHRGRRGEVAENLGEERNPQCLNRIRTRSEQDVNKVSTVFCTGKEDGCGKDGDGENKRVNSWVKKCLPFFGRYGKMIS
jgi:hypothetical protein